MFEKAILQKESLIAYHDILSSRGKASAYHPSGWETIEIVTQMLQLFKSATTALSGVYYPTSPLALNKIYAMAVKLSELGVRGRPYSDMVPPMKEKFRKYFRELPPVFTCAAALNPCLNIIGVESLIDRIANELDLNNPQDPCFSQTMKNTFQKHLTGMFDAYLTKYGTTSQIHDSMRSFGEGSSDPEFAIYGYLWDETTKRQRTNTPSSELGRYGGMNYLAGLTRQDVKNFDVLGWWKAKESEFPILASMARDLLTVQASTVASESAFSVSGRVLSIRRTRLTPPAVEMSICLKDYLDGVERIQDQRSLEGELEYEAELYEDEVDAGLTQAMTDEEAAFDEYLRNSSGSGED